MKIMKELIITNMNKITPEHQNEHKSYEYYKYEVTDSAEKYEVSSPNDGYQTVVAFYSLPPGKSSYPFHYHITNEEVFYVISGKGTVETCNGSRTISAGDIIVCPAGEKGAHKIINTSETENLVYLDVDTNKTPEIAFYPHSNKVGIRAMGGIRSNYDKDNQLGYYDNEPEKIEAQV
ncbi:MAG: cupin domain-containing protein [Defluviitaleaceae bacterium]|nr:cupin domain-containing protein [Defluviitaleaceae bacterium]MCL2239821.1 cupin domain-containing protein [Defluviitaleaceae bacterium]